MGEVLKMPARTKDFSNGYPYIYIPKDIQNVNYSSQFFDTTDLTNREQLVHNLSQNDYTNDTTRIFLKDLQTGNFNSFDEVGGETIMSEQLDRQKIQEMIEKELKSHERHFDLKLETMSTKLDAGLKDVESKLSQKIDNMNLTLLQTLQEIKSENALIRKDIELQSASSQSLVSQNFSDTKDLVHAEIEKVRVERKGDRRYFTTVFVSVSSIAVALTVGLLKLLL